MILGCASSFLVTCCFVDNPPANVVITEKLKINFHIPRARVRRELLVGSLPPMLNFLLVMMHLPELLTPVLLLLMVELLQVNRDFKIRIFLKSSLM